MIQFSNVEKKYGSRTIVRIPDMQLPKGIFWVQGKNGCGKTTLLKMVAGLLPYTGEILFNEYSLRMKPRNYRKNIGWAEAEPLYPPFITGKEILNFYQHVAGAAPEYIQELIKQFGIAAYLSTKTGSWSDGMIKRFSLLLAFAATPALVLLDEPFATLDAEAQEYLPSFLCTYAAAHECTMLFSSHQTIPSIAGTEIQILRIDEGKISLVS